MERQAVQSSNLRSVGYDPQTRTLEIEFVNGGLYQYFEVPEAVYRALMQAESLGRHFREHIRGAFAYQRVN